MINFLNPFFHIFSKPHKVLFYFCFTVLVGLVSCKTTRHSTYFKTLTTDTTFSGVVPNDYESKIKAGDQLSIVVTSLSTEEDALFNKAASTSSSPEMSGFKVYPDGTVLLHKLGRVKVEGLTRRELAAKLEKDLLPFMKDPIVNVNYLNHKITIIGDVGGPQVLPMPEEQLSVLDVLVKSGGIKENGLKSEVMIIREQGNSKQVKHINMEDHSVFQSEWFYLKPNDILYVKTDEKKLAKVEKNQKFLAGLSLLMTAVSFYFIVVDQIIQ